MIVVPLIMEGKLEKSFLYPFSFLVLRTRTRCAVTSFPMGLVAHTHTQALAAKGGERATGEIHGSLQPSLYTYIHTYIHT